MLTEPLPIQVFVELRIAEKPIQPLLEALRIESEEVAKMAVKHFKNMGIYEVTPLSEQVLLETLSIFVRKSPDVQKLVDMARAAEAKRKATKAMQGA